MKKILVILMVALALTGCRKRDKEAEKASFNPYIDWTCTVYVPGVETPILKDEPLVTYSVISAQGIQLYTVNKGTMRLYNATVILSRKE